MRVREMSLRFKMTGMRLVVFFRVWNELSGQTCKFFLARLNCFDSQHSFQHVFCSFHNRLSNSWLPYLISPTSSRSSKMEPDYTYPENQKTSQLVIVGLLVLAWYSNPYNKQSCSQSIFHIPYSLVRKIGSGYLHYRDWDQLTYMVSNCRC